MEITAGLVKDLREKTGAGMLECKKALTDAGGDMDVAIDNLRKKGLAAASKKADRVATEGLVVTSQNAEGAVLLEVNCETDFVAKNDDFKKFASDLSALILSKKPATVDELATLSLNGKETVQEVLNLLVAKIGEKLSIRRFVAEKAQAGEVFGSYIHLGGKIGVVVKLKGKASAELAKDVAMHIAAINPLYLNKSLISADTLAREKAIYIDQMKDSGKPANILEKIIEGKLAKFASDICLVEQIFIKDPTGKKTVLQAVKEVDPAMEIVSFTRYQVGEGMEKKKDDFASEVAKMVS